MTDNDTIVSQPIGRYRRLLAGGYDPAQHLYGTSEVYAARWHTLANPMLPERLRRRFQVLTKCLGQLTWISTDPENFQPC